MLCQVYYLLPDYMPHNLVYSSFVNRAGKIESNFEIDREVEHWNKKFKMDCKEIHGKITSKCIERGSNAYQDLLLKNDDNEVGVKRISGRHTKPNVETDTKNLAKHFIARKKGVHMKYSFLIINLAMQGKVANSLREDSTRIHCFYQTKNQNRTFKGVLIYQNQNWNSKRGYPLDSFSCDKKLYIQNS